MPGYAIERKRDALNEWRKVATDVSAGPGEIVVQVDLAALTSNNVTYAVFGGPPLHYWNFFPASDPDWGVVPVWGYATVTESQVDGIGPGSRYFGYWPSATHLKLRPGKLRPGGFIDTSPHRLGLAPVYNSYRTADEAPELEPLVALFQPLYGTGHVLAASLAAEVASGVPIILTSASSKTALSTAFNLTKAGGRAIGLTSAANRAFVESTGFYASVLSYDEIDRLDPAAPSVLIDFTGNSELRARLHKALTGLASSIIVGNTDWQANAPAGPLPGPEPSFFFAPTHWEQQARELGPAVFDEQLANSLRSFLATAPGWMETREVTGPEGYAEAFAALMENRAPARIATVWKP